MGNLSETEKLEGRMFRVVVVEVTYVYKPFGIYQVHPPNAATYFSLFPGIGGGRRRGGDRLLYKKDGAAGYNII